MEWPSKRVRPGGIFQPAKIKYSPETKNFLKVLMEESKLTMMQRQKINYALRSGDSLPSLSPNSANKQTGELTAKGAIKKGPPGSPRRRMYNTIIQSGAYEREKYVPKHPVKDRSKSIERLQNIMCYGKDLKQRSEKAKKKRQSNPPVPSEPLTFEQLQKEVEERQQFLQDMEKLGQGAKYRQIINQQIATLLQDMKNLDVDAKSK